MKKYPAELLTNNAYRYPGYISSSKLLALGLCATLASFSLPAARAASATWTGGADGLQTNLSANANWSTGSAAFVSGDVVTFDGTTALGTLTWNANIGPSFGATDGLHVAYSGAGNLTLDGVAGTPGLQWGLGNITIANGAGAFSFGNGAESTTLVYRGASNAQTYTNNSSNAASFASDILWRAGGGAAKTVTFDGTGVWRVFAPFRIDATQGQSGLTLIKNGTGTLELSGANNFGGSPATGASGFTVNQGTLSVTGAGSFGLSGAYAQPINLAGGTFAYGSTASQTFSGVISGSGALSQTAGSLTLTGANTFTGPVTVSGGTLTVSGSGTLNSAGSVIVDGTGAVLANNSTGSFTPSVSLRSGTLSGTGSFDTVTVPNNAAKAVSLGRVGAETLTVGNLTFQGAASLTINKVAASPATASVTVNGTLATTPASGKVTLNASLPFWTSAQFYNLIHAGSFSGNASHFQVGTVSGLTSRQSATVSVQGTDIGLMINGDTPRWTGAGNGIWDTSSTGNWSLIVGGGSTTYINGDVVQFDDTASNASVTIAASGVQPSSTQFNNSTLNYTVSGSGGITAGSLIKNGTGSLTVSSANTYSGGTIINAGTVTLSGAGTLGSVASSVTLNGGTLNLGGVSRTLGAVSVAGDASLVNGQLAAASLTGTGTSGNATVSAVVSGTGTVGMNGAGGTLTLTAANTYTGGTTVTAGTLALSGAGTLGGVDANATIAGGILDLGGTTQTLGTVTVSGAGVVQNGTLNNTDIVGTLTSGTADLGAVLTGDGTVTVNGAGGTLALSGANTYTGATTVTNGTLQLGNGEDSGSIAPASPITVASGATFAVNRVVPTVQGTDFGSITGAGGFTQRGASTTTLNAANTYTGTTNLLVGTLAVTANGALGTGPVNIAGFGNRLQLSGDITLANPINTGGGATVENVSGNNTLSGAFEFANVGNVVTTVRSTAGTLTLGGNLTISAGLNWTTANRVFDFVGAGNMTVNGAIHNSLTSVALIGLTKNGTGTLILNGTSDYTNPTFAYGGVLRIDGALAQNAGTGTASEVTVELDGTLAGTGSIAGNTGVYGILRPGAGGEAGGRLRFGGSLNLDGFSTTQFDLAGAVYTGVSSTLNSGVNYGGWLKLNFTSGVYNGNYQLFELTGTPNGSFSQVTLTTTAAGQTDLPLTQSGSVWSLTSGPITYAFDQSTGVLTVTGATNAVVPGATSLAAVAGDASVNLSWGAASNADSYVLRRSTTAGGPYTTIANGLGGLSYSDTGLTNGTTYYYVVMAKDSASGLTGPASAEVSATPAVASHSPLQQWRFDQFGVYDDDGSVLAGDAEDYDGDGLSNLAEYALGLDPKAASASPVTLGRSGNFLTLSYPRRSPADPALTYTVQASDNLGTGFTAAPGSTNTVGSTSTYTDTVDISASGVRRFLRLSVSHTP